MGNKVIITVLLILANFVFVFGEISIMPRINNKYSINLSSGFGSYNIESAKTALRQGLSNLPFPAKVVDDYPNMPYYGLDFCVRMQNYELGLMYSLISTGGKVHYADYSGNYTLNNIINSEQYGFIMKLFILPNKLIKTQLLTNFGISNLSVNYAETLNVFNESQNSNDKIMREYPFLEPGLRLFYDYNSIMLGLNATYFLLLQNDLNISFDGFRVGLFVGYGF